MDFKFSKGPDDGATPESAAGKSQQGKLLLLLLILLGGGAYIFFFTDLIRPQQAQQPAPAPPVAEVVKQPLPPRDGEPAKAGPTAAPEDKKAAPTPPPKPEPPKVAAAPAEAKKSVPAKSAAPAVKPAPAAKPEPSKASAAEEKKPPVADRKKPEPEKKAVTAAAKEPAKKTAEVPKQQAAVAAKPSKSVAKADKKPAGPASGRWIVLVGNYVLEEAMAVDLAKVRKAGLEASVKPGIRKKATMNRLYLAEFDDRTAAQTELDRLKRSTSDAFILDHGGKHAVYAGSYLLESRAASERERLGEAGFRLTLKRADVAIPSRSLTAGVYTDRKAAEEALNKLRNAGLKATLTH